MKKTFQDLVNLRLWEINFTGKIGEVIEKLKEFGFIWQNDVLVLPENPLKVEAKIEFDFENRKIEFYSGIDGLYPKYSFKIAYHTADEIFNKIYENIYKVIKRAD